MAVDDRAPNPTPAVARHPSPPATSSTWDLETLLVATCVADETALQRTLTSELAGAGFATRRDRYRPSPRAFPPRDVTNLLFVRGAPRVCLVAHTDVVRDHGGVATAPTPHVVSDPATGRRVLADRARATPIGGDDRVGVAIIRWLAQTTTAPMAALFTTDEEIGLDGAYAVPMAWLEPFELLVEIDRRSDHGRELVTQIFGRRLCTDERAARLLAIAADVGMPRTTVMGLATDVYAFAARGFRGDAVNLSCGYHEPHAPEEWVDMREAAETATYVRACHHRSPRVPLSPGSPGTRDPPLRRRAAPGRRGPVGAGPARGARGGVARAGRVGRGP